ncbi:maleylpyruvate isomerase N-terminal domain-containing protein [Mycolicibacterium rufum]|uniref:Maleylpyruvate isomerase N-terminal domain-containing protein n=1 Tax=Mycolicibacterium rufum TaxID=318424 RepID=A0A9X3BEF8_9MYCO|nr:maleylpyruvate isomerase N-terminal domain-containing protein [Mycolicibacterium rufum]KGI69794.1 mycothiol maleylpyruvate isomerase N-terminal domain protein [Mycolicibacterium rufum]MCV7069354.1 maleylpyruvate isomerase N-terminal domain-containing protein [Mycolicibacterium rufum]ULP36035.1 maleylpyruvate isomerase N-terminal domain-containing protein [Mycolicibacterium rufum]
MTDPRTIFASAARYFAALARDVPAHRWDDPGLGEWSVRDLVGHTSRSLITVSTYLTAPAAREDVTEPADYYVRIKDYAAVMGAAAIVERGRQAGRDLGPDPAATIDGLVDRVLGEIDAAGDPLIEVIGGLGLRLSTYLPTRTFEIAVHGLDIAAALGVPGNPPREVLADAAALAARIGVHLDRGPALLMALTGRSALPPDFSVV